MNIGDTVWIAQYAEKFFVLKAIVLKELIGTDRTGIKGVYGYKCKIETWTTGIGTGEFCPEDIYQDESEAIKKVELERFERIREIKAKIEILTAEVKKLTDMDFDY